MKCLFTSIFIFSICILSFARGPVSGEKEIYEWRIYTLTGNGAELDRFFSETLIPVYNRLGVSIGAFAPLKKEETELRYLLFVYPDLKAFSRVKKEIWKDSVFSREAQPFFDQTAPNPLYSNFESFLCEAFDKIPRMRRPDPARTLFEYRIYHSPNEEANQRKVKMFNVDEIDIFDKTGINSVCYGEILSGSRMPALIYLTWYLNEDTRNEAWEKFRNHKDWIRIKSLPEYSNTATNNKSVLLSPLPYSQF